MATDALTRSLLLLNVNEHTEKKNGLTYLSWAWAWAEVLKADADATWTLIMHQGLPMLTLPDGTAIVHVSVTIYGRMRTCVLPVMDHKNKAIANPNAYQVNTAIMRCLAKAIAMHGLGLYIYAGEDVPEGAEAPESEPEPTDPAFDAWLVAFSETATKGVEALKVAWQETPVAYRERLGRARLEDLKRTANAADIGRERDGGGR